MPVAFVSLREAVRLLLFFVFVLTMTCGRYCPGLGQDLNDLVSVAGDESKCFESAISICVH